MPQIIDYAYNYTTTTTGTTIACDVPDTATNDILIAILTQDTGTTPTWTCTGWTQYYTITNTTASALMWRVSTGASEPASYTFTTSSGETLNCIMISIRDVDTTTPFVTQVSANRASHNTAFSSITTNRDNCLILYISGHPSTTVIPSSLEGPVTQLFQMDGSAHSDSVGWGWKVAQGATGTSVISSVTGTTYNGPLITLAVRPPASGATLIPAYCSADASVYLDPIHGTTAFRGNLAYASTNVVTTYTGTNPLGGKAIAAATVSTRTDTGINSYRSTGGQTSSLNRTWLGAIKQFAAAQTTMAGKNILLHVKPYLPADIQTLEGIGLSRGIAVGFHTSNGNWKGWHVHGANTPFGVKMVPVVVNTGNTTGVIGTQGTLNTASIAGIGTFVSGFVASADMIWTMIWQLDTTTVCGGNATTPIDVPGIVRAVADGHERMSALQQGKNQMLVMQPIQIGDGTNPTYLNLSTAAIEFPQQYNVASQQVFYCSTDDVAGVTFYAATGDTFNISSSTWSSASRFHFKLHTSFSTSVTPNFDGASVIGAGTISLARAVTITNFTINNYSTLDVTALTLVSSNISNPPATSGSITTGTTAVLNLCTINVSTVTAGNYWWTGADPTSIFTNCTFTGGGGHALQISAAGGSSITLTGNTWTSFGANASTGAALNFTAVTGTITVNISGGNTPTYKSAGATINFVNAKTVKVTVKDANTLVVIPDARVLMEATSVATGTHTGSNNVATLTDGSKSFTTSALVGYRIYNTTDGSNGLITANNGTTVTATLAGGTDNDWDTSDAYIIVAKPALNPVSIASATTTATVTHKNHGLASGVSVVIRGATEDQYNGIFTISNVTTNTYDYTMSADPAGSSATGSPTSTAVILSDVTNASGILQTTTFNYVIDQPITGKVRKSTAGTLTITATSGSGAVATITFAIQGSTPFPAGTIIKVSGLVPSGYNGVYVSTGGSTTTVTYASTTTGSMTTAGTVESQLYKTGAITGTITSNGLDTTALLIADD